MGRRITGSDSEPRELIPARTYLAVPVSIVHLGHQPPYMGKGLPQEKWLVEYELHYRGTRKRPPTRAVDSKGNFLTICQFLPSYLGKPERKSALLELVEACEQRTLTLDEIKAGIDIEELLGKPVEVVVEHISNTSGKVTAVVTSTTRLDPDDEEPESDRELRYWEITPGSREIPEWIPRFAHTFIEKSTEFGGPSQPAAPQPAAQAVSANGTDDDDDPIPF